MAILPGTRLGPYEVLSAIGAGGMGEVYRARDMRLNRTVAIKVLPEHFADRPGSHERFEREAKTIASLNHPHICTLYDVGRESGTDYLVMEYIEGETLAQRLTKGPLPIQQTLQYAIEIADALDKAHRKGITHRDLKPGNIMLTKTGTKLLDFGLAKLTEEDKPAPPFTELPTQKDGITAEGAILGTLQYMAPEQVEGKDADARTDIFAFGLVVYEMATGKRAFEGKSQASLIAKILETEPASISTLQPMTPPALDRLVKKCLSKEPDKRWQAASDVCDELKWIAEQAQVPQAANATAGVAPKTGRERSAWLFAGIAIFVAVVAVAGFFYVRRPPAEVRPVRFAVTLPEKQSLPVVANTPSYLSVSPDGTKLAYIAELNGNFELWVRDLDSKTSQVLPGTDGAWAPFWSPDSRFVAFTTGSTIKKIPVVGGPAETIAGSQANGGGTWNRDGVILFSTGPGSRIYRVSAAGGSPIPIVNVDTARQDLANSWPQFLPDGKHFLYLAISTHPENTAVFVGSLDSKETKLLLKVNSFAMYSPPGYLVFTRAGTLIAQPFDASHLELKGDATSIIEGLQFNGVNGRAAAAISENGVLAYRATPSAAQIRLVSVDRKGTEQPLTAPLHAYRNPRLSPDGRRIAVTIDELGSQEWLFDIGRGTLTRLTFDGTYNGAMAWTPDGKRLAFGSDRQGPRNLFWQFADGSGSAERLSTSTSGSQVASSWAPDGQTLAFEAAAQNRGFDLFTLRLSDRTVQPFLATPFNEIAPHFSPDSRWLAYASDESGRYEVYVQPYPGPGGKWQISTEGGTEPVWARNGELFYRNGDKFMVVKTMSSPTFSASNPKLLFEGHYTMYQSMPSYDVSADGQQFVFLKPGEDSRPEIDVVVNWPEELKQRAAAGKQ